MTKPTLKNQPLEGYEFMAETVVYNFPPMDGAEIADRQNFKLSDSIDDFLKQSQISTLQQIFNPMLQRIFDRGFPVSALMAALEQSITLHWTDLAGAYEVAAMDKITWLLDDAVKIAKEQESGMRDRVKQSTTPVLIVHAKNEEQARQFWDNQNEIAEAVICGESKYTIEAFQFEVWLNGDRYATEGTERGLVKIID